MSLKVHVFQIYTRSLSLTLLIYVLLYRI